MLFRIMLESMGGTRRKYLSGLSFEEAYKICEDLKWELDTGYVWDLVIEEDD